MPPRRAMVFFSAVLAAGAVSCGSTRKKAAALGDALVADVLEVESRAARFPRPTHVASATPGTFGEHAKATIAPLTASASALPSWDDVSHGRVAHDDGPPTEHPCAPLAGPSYVGTEEPSAACRAQVAAEARDVAPLLAATHAEAAGLPEELLDPDPRFVLPRLRRVARALWAISLETRLLVRDGEIARAVPRCTDELAFARDLMWGHTLVGDMMALGNLEKSIATCVGLVMRASPPERRALAEGIDSVVAGYAPVSGVLARELVHAELRLFGAWLSLAQVARLPPYMRPLAGERARAWMPPRASWWETWRHFRERIVEASSAPTPEARFESLAALDHDDNPLAGVVRYAVVHERGRALLVGLAWVARASAERAEGRALGVPPSVGGFVFVVLEQSAGDVLTLRVRAKTTEPAIEDTIFVVPVVPTR